MVSFRSASTWLINRRSRSVVFHEICSASSNVTVVQMSGQQTRLNTGWRISPLMCISSEWSCLFWKPLCGWSPKLVSGEASLMWWRWAVKRWSIDSVSSLVMIPKNGGLRCVNWEKVNQPSQSKHIQKTRLMRIIPIWFKIATNQSQQIKSIWKASKLVSF